MIKVATARYRRIAGDESLTTYNLVDDASLQAKNGCTIYFCPSNAFGLDTIGSSYLLRKEYAINSCLSTLASECKEFDMLIIVGFLDYNSKQSYALIRSGSILFKSDDFSLGNFTDGNCKISIKDVNCPSTHFSSTGDIKFLIGSYPLYSTCYRELYNYIKFLSSSTYSSVFYSTPDSGVYSEADVSVACRLDGNYYEILPVDNNGFTRVEPALLKYHESLNNGAIKPSQLAMITPIIKYEAEKTAFPHYPLVDMEGEELFENYRISALNIANRLKASKNEKFIFGISGGVDSASTALLAHRAVNILKSEGENIDYKDVIAVSMPGFGTSAKTRQNSRKLATALGFSFYEIPIKRTSLSHFKDIKFNPEQKGIVFENAQARERTQILLDMANKNNALHLGTCDLSEAVLGWCTFAGDQCCMYNTNLSFSKTQLQRILSIYSENAKSTKNTALATVLTSILDTPISPELLPLGENGEIAQKTEDANGPYEIIDFLIYMYFYRGYPKEHCLYYLQVTFLGKYKKEDLVKWCDNFEFRFLHSQFKRSTSSQAPIVTKIGKIIYNYKMNSALMV